ncbi:hypothetical protein [Winogradskyella tangerina]|uniref:hypothetical protein n=1 Tax=Winogradskyella tangerina TaxID=2023240 RepID=UPI000DBE8D72|nr:hypothetical protein [Winogradskyella tangerina]
MTNFQKPQKLSYFLDSLRSKQNFSRLLDYGIGYKYDSILGKVYIYSYGPNKKDDSLKRIIFNHWTHTNFKIQNNSFSLSDYEGDIIIEAFDFLEENFLCELKKQYVDYENSFLRKNIYFKNNKEVKLTEKLENDIFHYQLVLNSEYKNLEKGLVFFKFENKELDYLCYEDKVPVKLFNDLSNTLSEQTEFDFAIFQLKRF